MGFRDLIWLAACALAVPAFAGAAAADEAKRPAGVVELFTSQGCNSCPPADEVFARLATADNVVALAYHVDYWDYLGWRDTLGKPENTARQYDYMRSFGIRSVYTPQAVINGRTHVNGASRDAVKDTLGRLAGSGGGMKVGVTATRVGDSIMIDTGAGQEPAEAHLVLVYFDAPHPVQIDRGENGGKTITYWNAVSGIQTAGMWHGKAARFELPMSEISKKGAGGCAVLLQSVGKDGLPGPILGATIIGKPIN